MALLDKDLCGTSKDYKGHNYSILIIYYILPQYYIFWLKGKKTDHAAFPLILIENLKKIYLTNSINHSWKNVNSKMLSLQKQPVRERESIKMIKRAVPRQNKKASCSHQNMCVSCEYSMINWTNISRDVQLPFLPGCWSRFGKVFVSHSTPHLQVEALHMKGSEEGLWAI